MSNVAHDADTPAATFADFARVAPLGCPRCEGRPALRLIDRADGAFLHCDRCETEYTFRDGLPDLRRDN